MAKEDDGVREHYGVSCRKDNESSALASVHEGDKYIWLDAHYDALKLTPHQARYLAAKLYRLSRRVRNRTEIE